MSGRKKSANLFNGEYWSYVIKNRRRKAWNTFVRFTACLVVFCTTYALILPAITVETNTYCGIEEHFHTDDCYVQDAAPKTAIICSPAHSHTADCYDAAGALACGMADYVVHSHGNLCYNASGSLICSLPEKAEHVHSDGCYTPAESAAEASHTHSDSCYTLQRLEQTCLLAETEGHAHGVACSTTTLICTTEYDAHIHVGSCYESALTCTQEEAAAHVHSDLCRTTVLTCESEDGEHEHTDECFGIGYQCGLEETAGHTHGEACYTAALICTAEYDVHGHGDDCYETAVTCTTEETEGHTHTDACFVTEALLSCGQEEAVPAETAAPERILSCTKEQVQLHTHSDSCRSNGTLTCAMLQVENHIHSDACLQASEAEAVLTCTLSEHTHGLSCYSNPNADLETAEDWERAILNADLSGTTAENLLTVAKTQLGYQESTENYIVLSDGFTTSGYSRYGAWSGNAYEDWNETFVEFCLHYAGIEETDFPRTTGSSTWIHVLTDAGMFAKAGYTPVPGDLVFFKEDEVIYTGIIREVSDDGTVTAILGDYENKVSSETLRADDEEIEILGYGILPEPEEAGAETAVPDTTAPEITEPETTVPETTEPETTEPETTEPETTEPETAEPELTIPLTASMTFELADIRENAASTFASRAAFFSAPYALRAASEDSLMTLDAGTAARSSTLDMAGMITGVAIYHRANSWDSWIQLGQNENVQSGDQVRFAIQYQVPGKTLSTGNDTIYYQLPVGSIPEAKSGNVYDSSGALVGTYTISTSGLIEITFNEHYVQENASGVAIDGTINFDSTTEALDTDSDGEIDLKFSDSESVTLEVEQTIRNDLTVEKEAAEIDYSTGLIKYSVTVSSVNGTNGEVTLTDSLSNIFYYTDDTYSLTVLDQNNNTVSVSEPRNGTTYLSLTLPEMGANSTYTLTYYGKVSNINQDSITAGNSVTVKSKNDNGHILTDSDYTQTTFDNTMVQKTGTVNGNQVDWTVNIAQSGQSLSSWTLSDTVNGAALQTAVTITYMQNGQQFTETLTLPFTFPEGATGPASATYTTTLDYGIGSNSMSNTAALTPPSHIPAYPGYSDTDWVQDSTNTNTNYPLNKESTGLSVTTDSTSGEKIAVVGWSYTIDASSGTIYTDGENGWYFDDYLQNDQYYTSNQWNTLLANITGALKSAYENIPADAVFAESAESYLLSSGDTVYAKLTPSVNNSGYKTGFKVTVYQNLEKGKQITFEYSSTGSLGDGAAQKHFQNRASINNKTWDSAAEDYYPVVTKMDGSNSSVSDTTHAGMDLTDDTLTWKILVVIPDGTASDVTITESLPTMVDLTKLTLQLPNYSTVTCPTNATTQIAFNNNLYDMVVSAVDSSNTFTISIPANMAQAFAGQQLTFTVTTKLNSSFALSTETNDQGWNYADLTNRVSVTTNGTTIGTDDHTQTITDENTTQQVIKVAKKGESNIVTYTVEINPDSADLSLDSDTLTIDDVMTFYSNSENYWFGANLVADSVKLHTLAEDGTILSTELLSADDYVYQQTKSGETGWVQVTNKLEVTVPDKTHLQLEYKYQLRGPENQGTQFNNTASIREVSDHGSSSSNTGFTITGSEATADLSSINVYKVAAGNYAHTIPGAEYELYKWNGTEWQWNQNITSGAGNLKIENLTPNTAYYLIEVNAPNGYILDETRHYFLMYDSSASEETYPITKPDDFPASAYVAKGGVVYITNEPPGTTSANVRKEWADGNPPDNASVEVQLMQVWNAPLSNTVGEDATVNISFGENSYTQTYTNTINAKVGDQITIKLTTNKVEDLKHAGLMQVTGTENIHIPYMRSGTTYTFTYLVNGDANLAGWYYDAGMQSITYETTAATLTKETAVGTPIRLDSVNGWTYSFTGLDFYDLYTAGEQSQDGAVTGKGQIRGYYTYYVKETAVNNAGYTGNYVTYTTEDGTLVITNQPAPTTQISAEKIWTDSSGKVISAPANTAVSLKLYQVLSTTPPATLEDSLASFNYSLNYWSNPGTAVECGTTAAGTEVTFVLDHKWGNNGLFYNDKPVTFNGTALTDPRVETYNWTTSWNTTETGKKYIYTFTLGAGSNSLVLPVSVGSDSVSVSYSFNASNKVPSGGAVYGNAVTLDGTADTNGETVAWNAGWTNLPLYKLDAVGNIEGYYSYYVLEDSVPSGYTVSYSTYDSAITEGTITVTNTAVEDETTTSITVKKAWKKADGSDGTAPAGFESIDFFLYQNGTLYKNPDTEDGRFTIHSTESWTKTIENLPAGYTYTVVEDSSALTNHTSTVTTSPDGTIVITNQEHPNQVTDTTAITVQKQWLSGAEQKAVEVQLYQVATVNGTSTTGTYGGTTELSSSNAYSHTWDKLPKSAMVSGQTVSYTYYVREVNTTGYNVSYSTLESISDGTITITNGPLDVDITVTKQWIYPNGSAAPAPARSIEFKLYSVVDSTEILVGTYTMTPTTADGNEVWTYTIPDALSPGTYKIVETGTGYTTTTTYKANGKDGSQDSFIEDGTFTIINTVETVSLTVNKVWQDAKTAHDSVSFQILQNNKPYGATYTLSDGGWTTQISGLPKYDENGNAYVYTVQELAVPGYSSSISASADGQTITITNRPVTDITVTKEWDGISDPTNMPDVTFRVYFVLNQGNPPAEGYTMVTSGTPPTGVAYTRYLSATVTSGNWQKTFDDLPVYAYDSESNITGYYTYYVDEVPMEGFTTSYGNVETTSTGSSLTVTNARVASIEIEVNKVWKKSDGTDGTAPEGVASVTVQLYQNGTLYGTPYIVTANGPDENAGTGDDWTRVITGLPYWDNNGKAHEYRIEEINVPQGYDYAVTGSVSDGFTVTNTEDPTTDLTVQKNWMVTDAEKKDIQFQLYRFESTVDPSAAAAGSTKYDAEITFQNNAVNESRSYPGLITGPGTYTMTFATGTPTEEIYQFFILIKDGYDVFRNYDISNVSLTVDSTSGGDPISIPVNSSKVRIVQNFEQNSEGAYVGTNNAKIEIYDLWNTTGSNGVINDNSPIANPNQTFAGNIVVTFTLSAPALGDEVLNGATRLETTTNNQSGSITLGTSATEFTWNDLPLTGTNSSNETVYYTYYVKELTTGYVTTYSTTTPVTNGPITVTNDTVEPIYTYLVVDKVWLNADGSAGNAPNDITSIQFKVLQNGRDYDADGDGNADVYTLYSTEGWTTTVKPLLLSDVYGNEYTYTVQEITTVEGYTATVSNRDKASTITNRAQATESDTTSVTVNKVWADGTASAEVNVKLVQVATELLTSSTESVTTLAKGPINTTGSDGNVNRNWFCQTQLLSTVTLSSGGYFTITYTSSSQYLGLRLIYSDWSSVAVGATSVISENGKHIATYSYQDCLRAYQSDLSALEFFALESGADDTIVSEITWTSVTTTVTGTGSITEYVYTATGSNTNPVTLSNGNWSYTWRDLPLTGTVDGKTYAYTYYVEEITTEGYDVTYSNVDSNGTIVPIESGTITVTNSTTQPAYTSLTVNKVWVDPDSSTPPSEISFYLYKSETEKYRDEAYTISASQGWSTTITDLPAGFTYHIEEIEVEGYTSEVTGSGTSFTITNTKVETEDTIQITVEKLWQNSAGDTIEPQASEIAFKLVNTDSSSETASVTLNVSAKDGTLYKQFTEYVTGNYAKIDIISFANHECTVDAPHSYSSQSILYNSSGAACTVWGHSLCMYTFYVPVSGNTIVNASTGASAESSGQSDGGYTIGEAYISFVDTLPDMDTSLLNATNASDETGTGSHILNADNEWKKTITGLTPGNYQVVEITEGYTVLYSVNGGEPTSTPPTLTGGDTLAIINQVDEEEQPDQITLTVEKQWVNIAEGVYPLDSIQFKLFQVVTNDGTTTETQIGDTCEITKDGGWKTAIDGLAPGTYRIEEVTTGYTVTYTVNGTASADGSGFFASNGTVVITNEATQITVTKKWLLPPDVTAIPVDSIQFKLYQSVTADGNTTKTQIGDVYTMTPGENGDWSYTVYGLPKTDPNGLVYDYSITETTVDGYRADYDRHVTDGIVTAIGITNQPATDLSVQKRWSDGITEDKPDIQLLLYRFRSNTAPANVIINHTDTVPDVTGLTPYRNDVFLGNTRSDEWSKTYRGLHLYEYDSSGAITVYYSYYVMEAPVENFTPSYSVDNNGEVVITNTQTVSVAVRKEWKGLAGQTITDHGVASVQVQLYRDDEVYGDPIELSEANLWTAAVTGLPKYSDAASQTLYTYSFKEVDVPDGYEVSYSTAEDGTYLVTNQKSNSTEITVTKKWLDSDGQEIQNFSGLQEIYYELYRITTPVGSTSTTSSESTNSVSNNSASQNSRSTTEIQVNAILATHNPEASSNVIKTHTASYAAGTKLQFTITNTTKPDFRKFADGYKFTWGSTTVDPISVSDSTPVTYTYEYVVSEERNIGITTSDASATWSIEVISEENPPSTTDPTTPDSGGGSGSGSSWTPPEGGEKYGDDYYTLSYGEGWTDTITDLPLYAYDGNGSITGYYSYYIVEKASTTNNYTWVSYENNNGITSGNITVTNKLPSTDTPSYELPATGGSGIGWHLSAGLAMILGAAYLLYADRKRKKRAS